MALTLRREWRIVMNRSFAEKLWRKFRYEYFSLGADSGFPFRRDGRPKGRKRPGRKAAPGGGRFRGNTTV